MAGRRWILVAKCCVLLTLFTLAARSVNLFSQSLNDEQLINVKHANLEKRRNAISKNAATKFSANRTGYQAFREQNKMEQKTPKQENTRLQGNETVHTVKGNETVHTPRTPQTDLGDVFIALKTTGSLHSERLDLMLNTWIPLAKQSIYVFTDTDDAYYSSQFERNHFINTKCGTKHFRGPLVCKVGYAYDTYIQNPKRWLCLFDDDTYVNVPNLLSLLQKYNHIESWYLGKPSLNYPIRVALTTKGQVAFWFATGAGYCISRGLATKMVPYVSGGRLTMQANLIHLPDDVTMGFVINYRLGVELTRVETFHSHLEGLRNIPSAELHKQVTLSYGIFQSNDSANTINIINTGEIPTFDVKLDPTRLMSVHCHFFPHVSECKRLRNEGYTAQLRSKN